MTNATTTNRQKLAILVGVVVFHVLVLWALQIAWERQPTQEVIAIQLVKEPNAPLRPALAQPAAVPQQAAPVPSNVVKQAVPVAAQAAPTPPPAILSEPLPAAAPTTSAVVATSAGTAKALHSTQATANTSTGLPASPPVELPSSDADYLHNPKPEYPRLSRQRNEQGKVVVNVLIGTDGLAQKANVKVSSGFERLDAAAVSTALTWRYVPGKRGGVPEAMWFAVPINFVMD